MTELDQEDAALLQEFCEEAADLLEATDAAFVELETNPTNIDVLNLIFRSFHTIKGNSAYFGLMRIKDYAHKVEGVLGEVRKGVLVIDHNLIDALLVARDHMCDLVQAVGSDGDVPVEKDAETITVLLGACGRSPAEVLEMAGGLIEDLVEHLAGVDENDNTVGLVKRLALLIQPAARAAKGNEETLAEQSDGGGSAKDGQEGEAGPDQAQARKSKRTMRVDEEKIDQFMSNVGEVMNLVEIYSNLQRKLDEGNDNGEALKDMKLATRTFQEVADKMQSDVMEVRQVPIRGVMTKLTRIIRDTGRSLGKEVEISSAGNELLIDKSYIEVFEGPLVHMVRNAIDHGIETPEVRQAAGKPRAGHVEIQYLINKDYYEMVISDDGSGMDARALRKHAVEKNVISKAEADGMTDEATFLLIFRPGFSTATVVTDVSGRGVGMDVVMSAVTSVGGAIKIDSELGKGSTFTIQLPRSLTLVVAYGLMVDIGGTAFIIPMESLRETIDVDPLLITKMPGGEEVITVRGEPMPFVRLAERLSMRPPAGATQAVVVTHKNRTATLEVSRAIGLQKVVVKSMEDELTNSACVRGGAVMGDGAIGLVLDVSTLV